MEVHVKEGRTRQKQREEAKLLVLEDFGGGGKKTNAGNGIYARENASKLLDARVKFGPFQAFINHKIYKKSVFITLNPFATEFMTEVFLVVMRITPSPCMNVVCLLSQGWDWRGFEGQNCRDRKFPCSSCLIPWLFGARNLFLPYPSNVFYLSLMKK